LSRTADDHWTLAWTSQPGRTYRLQFKDRLEELLWHDLPNEVTATDLTATQTDPGTPGNPQRFYRIVQLP
jgi:hypothetical protein